MQKITFDTGVQSFEINGSAVLRFNPSDPNVYSRFFEAKDKIEAMGAEYEQAQAESEQTGEAAVRHGLDVMRDIDCRTKKLLGEVFGTHNDFEAIFSGTSMFAVGEDGEYIITHLFEALLPVLEAGVEKQVQARTQAVKLNRAQRRALIKGTP